MVRAVKPTEEVTKISDELLKQANALNGTGTLTLLGRKRLSIHHNSITIKAGNSNELEFPAVKVTPKKDSNN